MIRQLAQRLLWTQQVVKRCGSTRCWQTHDQESNAGGTSSPAQQQPVQTKKVLGRFGFTFFTLKPRGVLMGMFGASGRSPLLRGKRERPVWIVLVRSSSSWSGNTVTGRKPPPILTPCGRSDGARGAGLPERSGFEESSSCQ